MKHASTSSESSAQGVGKNEDRHMNLMTPLRRFKWNGRMPASR